MCTAITFQTNCHYFGRNLDLERSYGEAVTITPRNFPFRFRCGKSLNRHYAMIGMAVANTSEPLYYDATNERGLSIAGLNFPGNAVYQSAAPDKTNIAPFEVIPFLLSQFETVDQAVEFMKTACIYREPYTPEYPLTPLHWLIADRKKSVTVEPMKDGIRLYDNPVGVLTNNPPFDYHLHRLSDFMQLTHKAPENRFAPQLKLSAYSLGMGSMGLPGDLSSSSRFIKAAFTKWNSVCGDSEEESVTQFFHILESAAQQRGLVLVKDEDYEYTRYSSCCNMDSGIYYYTTYENRQINAVKMEESVINQSEMLQFPLEGKQSICFRQKP